MNPEQIADVLDDAADAIERDGWGQGPETWDNDHGEGRCIEGGILAALGVTHGEVPLHFFRRCPAYRAVCDYLGDNIPRRGDGSRTDLWAWNDAEERTGQEVLDTLRAAAKQQRMGGAA